MASRYLGIPKFDPETNCTKFILGDVPVLDPDISLLLGDAAHNLRTALDHVATELARSVGVTDKVIYFPICVNMERYNRDSPGKTVGIPSEAKHFIDRIRPYGGHNEFLWGLHELDRIDKHRLVLTTTAMSSSWTVALDGIKREVGFGFSSELKAGTIIGHIEGHHESDKQMSVVPDIAFREPEFMAGEALFPNLDIMANMVEEIVLMFGPNPL